jgi:SAM-dependent methyltransferase
MTQQEYLQQFETFRQQSENDGRFTPRVEDQNAILSDDGDQTIHISWDYWIHTAWAARKLAESKPECHLDFGSYVYFAGLCSAFIPNFKFYDVRPINFPLPGLHCGSADLTALPFADNSHESLSCLHVLEHIGLGRYGDKLDASGDRKAAAELSRVIAPGGRLLIVLPMNEKPRVHFNAHRFYSFPQVNELFRGLALIDNLWLFNDRADNRLLPKDVNYTGCLVFTK